MAESPCRAAAMQPDARRVVAACEAQWEANQSDCTAFLKAVASVLGISDFSTLGNADAIVQHIDGEPGPWKKLPPGDGAQARMRAAEGQLVVGGLTSAELGEGHGHVVVVTAGDLVPSGDNAHYPRAFWGKLGGVGRQCEGLNYAFGASRRGRVRYFHRPLS